MSSRTENWKRELKVGAVVRRSPGVTRWAREIWKPVAVIPGAPEASWKEMVREGDVVDYHAGTVCMELFRADVESYLVSLNMTVPSVWIIMDRDDTNRSPSGWFVSAITASAFEAQDALDSGESIVEPVPIPESLAAWIKEFVDMHYIEEPFKKRRRDEHRIDGIEDGKGDARIRQQSDVFRAPSNIKKSSNIKKPRVH
ncbi:DUF3305 domain-containing protein [Marinobacter alexandrii]|jgi:hypothetical protein|uniref:DUF3305 domain-containing protein n=1 Tax=Marinobacter alexandrii TaxID=2570351 RepID=UPI002ABE8E52|nr:DUF3305 domain-containing protein [Marinobacter alexandrii]